MLFVFVCQLRAGKRAIRIQRVKEPLLLTLCTATSAVASANEEAEGDGSDSEEDSCTPVKGRNRAKPELGPNMKLDMELYEGIVSQPIIEPSVSCTVVCVTLFSTGD